MIFDAYLEKIKEKDKRTHVGEILEFIHEEFPELDCTVKWNQPFFLNEGTFIIAVSVAKNHMSIAPEEKTMEKFADRIDAAGYSKTKGLFKIKFSDKIDWQLLIDIIAFNIKDKNDYTRLWR
ncbi:iron chaperone [Phocicoccus pinnipedialis]|uniref:Intracellular iron chaperone frataxin n=1 Tax=Phocicoccus pinnipedialis TaxID=110845 RepID=A0A6V7R3V6_9BACL|nr:DUF1801 domain-containing protein [Jeotgalicoccus pinnipedialis]MBP1940001.1 uncharacterized protein YdhG (YjbR/CyaY superfamily) [Jeotgalicoccus pinnipedialis]CAD2072051.1 Intracellular iron chaperone frataxin [Jeotgalicoccus pinnipedialis]